MMAQSFGSARRVGCVFVNFEICQFSLSDVLIGVGEGDYVGSFRCAYRDHQLGLLDMLIWIECVFVNFKGRCVCGHS